ncbi:piggyBac transposable element-derived protein 4-like [Clarias gariepinus]|uniref:piggyBac transposable element-derived protein 4-like n=1 Tax=Clarias gariepinus TaxID=13013 RepID=UPI00234D284E|nr:piggyBac transposable element-derived protein 4-like [Clarias gariepinus]
MAEGVVSLTAVKQEPDEDPGDPNNASVDMKEALVQTDIKIEKMLQEGFHGIKKENPDIFVASCFPATPSPATPLASFPFNLPHPTCDTTLTKATKTCCQSSQTDLPSTNISQKRERLTPHEETATFEAGSGGMMTRSKFRASEKMTLFVLGSREMTTPAKRFSDVTTPARLGSSGIKSSGTKKFKKRRMLVKNGSREKGSNGMVMPTMKGFIKRATPTKDKSSVMTSTEEGLCGLTAPVVEESRRISAQAKQRSNQYSASFRKRPSESTAADKMGFTGTTNPGQDRSSCINIAGEEGSCGILSQARKRSIEWSASAVKRSRMWTTPSEENDSTDPTTSSDKVSIGLRTPSHGPTISATEDSSDLTTPGSNDFNRWHSATDEDEQPPALPFCPKRTPGVQLDSCRTYSPSELFQLYFSRNVIQTLCDNTNTNAKRKLSQGKTTSWSNVHPEDMLTFLSIIIYFSLMKTSSIRDLWRKDQLQNLCFPSCIMQRKRFEDIKAHLRMSDPGEDAVNDQLKGHPKYDHLFSLKPLMDQIHTACRSFFHPYENLSMDEHMVVMKTQTGLKQYLKDKWGYKLFTLADCKTGYVCDFSISECKAWKPSKNGLSFNVVTGLLNVSLLGTGYNVYIDDIHSSPALFTHLHQLNYRVCGTMQVTSSRIPSTLVNAMPKKAQQGEMRWIRDGPLLFVKWKDTREVTMCSSIHKAYNGKTAERRIRKPNGTWSVRRVPVPEPVLDYKKHMGQAELSDALKYYSHTLKSSRWFFKMFLNFIEIAVINSYILHKELALEKQGKPLTQKHFREVLCQELAALCSKDSATFKTPKNNLSPLPQPHEERKPQGCFPVRMYLDSSKMKSQWKKTCMHCHSGETVFKCRSCDVPLCITMDRMCFTDWHDSKKN